MKINEKTKTAFIKKFEDVLKNNGDIELNLDVFEEKVDKISREEMEKTFWKSLKNEEDLEAMWFTKEIRKEISKRRAFNKKKRKARDAQEHELYESLYNIQKKRIQGMVIDAIKQYEWKTTEEIIRAENKNKSISMYIKKLQGKTLIKKS